MASQCRGNKIITKSTPCSVVCTIGYNLERMQRIYASAVAPSRPRAAFQTAFLRPRTPSRRRSSTGTVCSQEMQASVTDWPYLSVDFPDAGISWRPSVMFDSIMTPMIKEAVSPDSSWRAWKVKITITTLNISQLWEALTMSSATSICLWCCFELLPWLQSICSNATCVNLTGRRDTGRHEP